MRSCCRVPWLRRLELNDCEEVSDLVRACVDWTAVVPVAILICRPIAQGIKFLAEGCRRLTALNLHSESLTFTMPSSLSEAGPMVY